MGAFGRARFVMCALYVLLLVVGDGVAAGQQSSQRVAGAVGETTPAQTIDWPRWRGPRGDGTWNGPPLAEQWPASGLQQIWRNEIGGGYAGVIATQGRILLFDRQTDPRETERLHCYSADNGELLWRQENPVTYGTIDYGNGPRAAPTVVEDRVYLLGTLGDLQCRKIESGGLVWSKNLVKHFGGRQPMWGYSASPMIHKGKLFVQPGGENGTSIVALDPATGEQIWGTQNDEAGYAPPIVVEHAGYQQLLCWTPSHIRAVDPDTGELLWSVPYEVQYGVSIATPIYEEGLVFVSAYWAGSRAMRPVAPGQEPDLVYEENRNLRGLMSQPLYRDGYGYLLDKQYGLTCFEFRTGKKLWDDKNSMTPRSRNPQATLVWLGDSDRVIALNANGELIQARINPDGYQELSRAKILGDTWAHPAYAGNRVFARSDTELVCYELPLATR